MRCFKTTFIVSLITILFFTSLVGAGYAATFRGGTLNKFKSVTATDGLEKFSDGYDDVSTIPDMVRTFRTRRPSKLVITFSAEFASVTSYNYMWVDVQVDGANLGSVGFIDNWEGDTGISQDTPNSFTWVTDSVRPGEHTVRVLWATEDPGWMSIKSRTLLIQHR